MMSEVKDSEIVEMEEIPLPQSTSVASSSGRGLLDLPVEQHKRVLSVMQAFFISIRLRYFSKMVEMVRKMCEKLPYQKKLNHK